MKIRAVLFDFGMVLSGPPDLAAKKQMELVFGVKSIEFSAAYWQFRDAYDRGRLNAASYWRAVAEKLHQPLASEQLSSLLAADTRHWTQPNQPMIDWAFRLRAEGVKVGLLSNIGDEMEAGVLQSCSWLKDFDHLTFSHRLGIAKPDAAIYRCAARGLGVAPAEILFIDDREENVIGARSVGMTSIQYTDREKFIAALQSIPSLPQQMYI